MAQASREKKLAFIATFRGRHGTALAGGVSEMLGIHGADWLTDEQVADVTSYWVSRERFRKHINIQNRRERTRQLSDVERIAYSR